MAHPTDRTNSHLPLYFVLAAAAWLTAMALTWPCGLSFGDEIGYVGQAKLFLEGRVHPLPNSPGVWVATPLGRVAQYPLTMAVLITPLLAAMPRAIFASGALAAIALAWIASRALRAWGRHPSWALIVLAHPSIVILSRTVMADLIFSLLAVWAWYSLGRSRRLGTVLSLAGLISIKPIGFVLALALIVGEEARRWPEIRRFEAPALARIRVELVGVAAGFAALITSNLLTTGQLWFSYDHRWLGTPPFWFTYLPVSGRAHLLSLLLNPPLLIAGVWPFWRRRDFGAVLLILGMSAMMSFYFFVDTGKSRLESLILSPRLILPVVAFLLIGYADLLAGLWDRLAGLLGASFTGVHQRALQVTLVVVPAVVAFGVGQRHKRWQEPMGKALAAATAITDRYHVDELWLTDGAIKAGVLFAGRTRDVDAASQPKVILCNTENDSYRWVTGRLSCERPGYQAMASVESFQVMVRQSD